MKLTDALLESVKANDRAVERLCVGLHWTVLESVVAGISHTYKTGKESEPEGAGELIGKSAVELSRRLRSWDMIEAGIGLASLNSMIPVPDGDSYNVNSRILEMCPGMTITVIGRFPFNSDVAKAAGRAYFIEIDPRKK